MNGVAVKLKSKCTQIPLRFENKEVKLGSATWSLNAALRKALATNSNTAKNRQTELSAKKTRQEKRKTNKNKEGHIVGTGVSAPSSPPGQVFLVRLACDGHRWAKLEGN